MNQLHTESLELDQMTNQTQMQSIKGKMCLESKFSFFSLELDLQH